MNVTIAPHRTASSGPEASVWQQYKRTFLGMQVMIAAVSAGAYLMLYRQVLPVVTFFLVMQFGSVAGALWATRLKRRFR